STRISNVRKFSELSSRLIDRSGQSVEEIAAELILYPHGDLFEAQGAKLGHHATRLQRRGEFLRSGGEKFFRSDADGFGQGCPALGAGEIGGGIAAVPPHKKQVG